jgi:hypothetical protein
LHVLAAILLPGAFARFGGGGSGGPAWAGHVAVVSNHGAFVVSSSGEAAVKA